MTAASGDSGGQWCSGSGLAAIADDGPEPESGGIGSFSDVIFVVLN